MRELMRSATIVAASLAVLTMAATAYGLYASAPTVVTWADNFDGETLGIVPGAMSKWTGGGPNGWSVVSDGGNKVVSDTTVTNQTSGYTYAWTSHTDPNTGLLSLGLEPYDLQVLHFKARQVSAGSAGLRQIQVAFQFTDADGNPIGGWRITGQGYESICWNAAHSSNGSGLVPHLGPTTLFADANYHDFDMHWYKNTGWMEWYVDGALFDSFDYSARGVEDAAVIQWDNNASHNDQFYYDDIQAGTIPEPCTVVLLGLGCLLAHRRRPLSCA